jgi:putative effector of murein hydrolase LrgA (UPF0299 family)
VHSVYNHAQEVVKKTMSILFASAASTIMMMAMGMMMAMVMRRFSRQAALAEGRAL